MSRNLRPHMPGVVFHLTARIQCHATLLCGIEAAVVAMIREATARSDARLVAYAVMPNHLHILLQQGSRPLSHYMQPLLRRVALKVRYEQFWEGHVFERRYRESACLTPDYVRNAIAYVHLNGLRAGLVTGVDDYEWCSQHRFMECVADDPLSCTAMEDALRLFAALDGDTLARCRGNYRAFVRWRIAMDAHAAQLGIGRTFDPPSPPSFTGGDEYWFRTYARFMKADPEHAMTPRRRLDLRDLAVIVMRDFDPAMRLDDLRNGGRSRTLVQVRRKLILRATADGYTGRAIARFLSISPATVSSARHSE